MPKGHEAFSMMEKAQSVSGWAGLCSKAFKLKTAIKRKLVTRNVDTNTFIVINSI